jgi:hypothetical protein
MLVDVAPGQALSATYTNDAHDYPGINRQLACQKAQDLASDLLATLRTQQTNESSQRSQGVGCRQVGPAGSASPYD